MNIDWQPIYSVERSGVAEVTMAGAICVVEGNGNAQELPLPLLTLGDVGFPLWTRSLLKPWQLLSHLSELKVAYPQLTPEHLAIMMASHNADPSHLKLLDEIMSIGGCKEEWLLCPATYPHSREFSSRLKSEGKPERRIYHNCSGKHFGYLMAIKAAGGDVSDYTSFSGPHFVPLEKLLCAVLHKDRSELTATTDGCQLPNYAVTIREMATLYQGLANIEKFPRSGDSDVDRMLDLYPEILSLIRQFPETIGGNDRLDTKIISGALKVIGSPPVIAKEGAQGLLAIGVGKTAAYPNGLGIVIKLSGGLESKHTEMIASEILAQLGLCPHPSTTPSQPAGTRTDHLKIKFHFKVNVKQAV